MATEVVTMKLADAASGTIYTVNGLLAEMSQCRALTLNGVVYAYFTQGYGDQAGWTLMRGVWSPANTNFQVSAVPLPGGVQPSTARLATILSYEDGGGAGTPHIFVASKLAGNAGPVTWYHFIDQAGHPSTIEPLVNQDGSAVMSAPGDISVCASPDGFVLSLSPADVTANYQTILTYRWADYIAGQPWKASGPPLAMRIPAQYLPGLSSNVSIASYSAPSTDDPTGRAVSIVVATGLGARPDYTPPCAGLIGEAPMTLVNGSYTFDPSQISWTPYGPGGMPAALHLHLGADGRIYLTDFDGYQVDLYARGNDGSWQPMPNPLANAPSAQTLGDLTFAYVPGDVTESPSPVNPGLNDALMPLTRMVIYQTRSGLTASAAWVSQDYGKLRRRALEKVPSELKMLVGIIEGPPPIPVENMNLPDTVDPTPRGAGSTTFAQSQISTSGFTANWSAAVLFTAKGEGGFLAKATAELELKVAYKGTYSTVTTSTSSTAQSNTLKAVSINGQYAPQPYGTAVLLGMDWTGFIYEYVDSNGSVPDNAQGFRQIFPMDMVVTSQAFVMNPGINPQPGNLPSYILTPEEKLELDQNAVLQFSAGGVTSNHLTNSWSLTSKTTSQFEQYQQTQYSNGLAVDLKAMVGGKIDVFEAKVEMKGGVQLGTDLSWSSGQTAKIGVSTDVTTRGSAQAVGSYYFYDYYTYQLAPSTQWTADLLASLVTPTWPADPAERQLNQALHDTIAPFSAPWLLTYAVGEYHKVTNLSEAIRQAGATVRPALLARLEAAGIRTTAQLHDLVHAATAGGPSELPREDLAVLQSLLRMD